MFGYPNVLLLVINSPCREHMPVKFDSNIKLVGQNTAILKLVKSIIDDRLTTVRIIIVNLGY